MIMQSSPDICLETLRQMSPTSFPDEIGFFFQSTIRDRRLVAVAQSSADRPQGDPLRQPGVRQGGRRQSFARAQQAGSGSTSSGRSDELVGK